MDDFQKLLLETFAEEARETVQALEKALLELEQARDADARAEPYATLARRAHNLKGAAGAAGIAAVQSLAHALEDGLLGLRESAQAPAPEVFDLLYVAVDTIRDLAESGRAAGAPEARLEAQLIDLVALQARAQRGEEETDVAPEPTQAEPAPDPSLPAPGDSSARVRAATEAEALFLRELRAARSERLEAVDPLPGIPADVLGPDPFALPARDPDHQRDALAPTLPPAVRIEPVVAAAPAPAAQESVIAPAPATASAPPTPAPPAASAPDGETRRSEPPVRSSAPTASSSGNGAAGSTTGGGGSNGGGGGDDDASRNEPGAPRRTVRIAVDKLDALMNQIGEIITVRKKSQARLAEVSDLSENLAATTREFAAVRKLVDRHLSRLAAETTRGSLDEALDTFALHLASFESRFNDFHRLALHEATTESLLTERLPEDIKRLRMRPFATLDDLMRRTVRDAARHCGKQIRLELSGLDNEADQVVLDVMRDPLMHLLRNCVDHGIEDEATRLALGKDPTGRVFVHVEARGATLYINIGDDGIGIDPRELKRRVRERNLLPGAQLDALTDRELIDLIFLPGFSTAPRLGVISGRGIGMDVVREVVQQHHGSISVRTEPRRGTTFELTMPLTFATVQGIIVRVLGHDFALPMYALDRLIRLSRKDIVYIEGTPTVLIEDQPISIVPMAELLEVPPDFSRTQETPEWEEDAYAEAMLYGAVVRSGDKRIAFLVDDFVGESEMVVKELPGLLGRVRNVSGATITWSGEVMVILNPADLVVSALRKASGGIEREWNMERLPSRRVLVCDDSVTTRTLEKNILAAAGYDVVTATNGLEALKIADEQAFQLIVLDVDMPEMTGFELAARLRMTPAYRDVPIILVTSRDTDEDKRRGLAAGADAYITKQSFTQRTFLETVRRFLA